MAYSYKKGVDELASEAIKKGLSQPWKSDPFGDEVQKFFNYSANKETSPDERKEFSAKLEKLPGNSIERWFGNLIMVGAVSQPRGRKGPRAPKAREFVSAEQKLHYDLYRALQAKTEKFWESQPEFAKLANLKRTVKRTRDGKDEEVKVAVEPMVYMRNASAIMNSYEVA